MKLTQFATAAILVLLAVAGYLTLKSDLDAKDADRAAAMDRLVAQVAKLAEKQAAAPVASPPPAPPVPDKVTPAPAPAASVTAPAAPVRPSINDEPAPPMVADNDPRLPPRIAEDESKILNMAANDRVANESVEASAARDGKPLNPVQSRIVALPAIAQVKLYSDKEGMNLIVLNRGTNANMRAGDSFALRRGSAVIGRVKISTTIDSNECVADLVPNSMPAGMTPAAGDDIIQFDP